VPSDNNQPSGLRPADGQRASAPRSSVPQRGEPTDSQVASRSKWKLPDQAGMPAQNPQPGGSSHPMGSYPSVPFGGAEGGRARELEVAQPAWTAGQGLSERTPAAGAWSGEGNDLLAACKEEFDLIGRELDEIRMLIKQANSELEKLNQRKVLAAAKTREMEEHIETFSRQEIRASYLASSEAEMRAFMMNEQREGFLAKEKLFERYQRYLQQTIEVLSAMPTAGSPSRPQDMSFAALDPMQAAGPRGNGARGEMMAALARVIQAQEDVRQRVAQRLHDGPAQSLANVVLTAEICEKLLDSDPPRARGELGNLRGLVSATLQDTRKFIFELRPMTLDDLGLVATLRRYTADLGAKYHSSIEVQAPHGEQRLPKEIEVPVFRVAQEALINAIVHGRASRIRLTYAVPPDGAVLVVEDNGGGFDVEQALAKARAHETVGIASMQERAEMLGGWLRIESARGHGSRVELSVPRQRGAAGQ
jgi:two-component system sensor histidine kinase DegS